MTGGGSVSGRLRRRLAALARRLGLRPGASGRGGQDEGGQDRSPTPVVGPSAAPHQPWPVPQLAAGGTGVLHVAAPAAPLPAAATRAHPNRLAGDWSRLVVDTGALVAPGVWAGTFGPGGTATGAALARVAAAVDEVEVRWDVPRASLEAAGIDVGRLAALERGP